MPLIRQTARTVFEILGATYQSWRADRAIRLGAALAYYAVFAAVPLLTSAIAIAGMVFSESQIQEFISESLEALLINVSDDLRGLIDSAAGMIDDAATSGGLATISVLVGIFAASLLFVALQDSLNMIWKIPVGHGLRYTIRRRAVAFVIVLLTGAVLVASLSVQAIALIVDEILGGSIGDILHLNDLVVSLATWALGVGAIAVLFQLLVQEPLSWRNTMIVSALIAILMVAGTWIVGLYFSNWGSASLSGVSGGVVVLLTWLYYLSQIVIAGAELLKTMEERTAPTAEG